MALAACDSPAPEPTPEPRPVGQNTATQGAKPSTTQPAVGQKTQAQIAQERQKAAAAMQAASGPKKINAKPAAEIKPSEDDPLKGKWTLAEATKGLPAGNAIFATIETDMGKLECRLFDDKAPITVANFIGLARGTRPWKNPEGEWVKKPAYDGTVFHRIIKGFMIQGGDAKKNGTGEAGYVIPDEVWEDARHDRPGLLCMANRGPNTNSAQFFITDAAAAHLDYNERDPRSSGYTIFGECGPIDLVHKIASVEMDRGDKPKKAPEIKKVSITRKKVTEEKKADDAKKTDDKSADDKKADDKAASPAGKVETDPKKAPDAKRPTTTPGPVPPASSM
jgi:peptidyl-prolyl cis-trans isomerase A (cyclophilin A)